MAFYSNQMVTRVYYKELLGEYDRQQSKVLYGLRHSGSTDFATLWGYDMGNVNWFFRTECLNSKIATLLQKKDTLWRESLFDLLEEIESGMWI